MERDTPALESGLNTLTVTLCGSTRHKSAFRFWEKHLAFAGVVCLSVGLFGHEEGLDMAGEMKNRLDALHRKKIAMSNAIVVLNVGGRIGLSTCGEILFAVARNMAIFPLESLADMREALAEIMPNFKIDDRGIFPDDFLKSPASALVPVIGAIRAQWQAKAGA